MYVKPEVTRYSGAELIDLMGPVETAYDCDIEIQEQFVPCTYDLRVSLQADVDDYRSRMGWHNTPEDLGVCDDREGSGVIGDGLTTPYDECFTGPEGANGGVEMLVDLCCLADLCTPTGSEQWMLDLTFFRKSGTEDTCGIELDVGGGSGG